MADTTLPPVEPEANALHHQSLSAIRQAWDASLATYLAAAARTEQFKADRLRPAYTTGKRSFAQVSKLEAEADRLFEAQADRLWELLATPAPDLPALIAKMDYSYRDYLIFELSSREAFTHLMNDARRFCS